MKQVILTESQINILMESDMIIESIFNIGPIKNFKYNIKKLIKNMLIAGMSVATIYSMINDYCDKNNIPEITKQEVIEIVDEFSNTGINGSHWELANNNTIATVYNAIPAQCNGDFGHTASMFRLNLNDVLSQRVIAMERTFMRKLGLKYGDVVYISGTGKYDGVWQIQDTMNKRFAGQNKIDILVSNNITYGTWENVKLYVLKDKSLTDQYRSKMAPQISEKELKLQVAQKKKEFKQQALKKQAQKKKNVQKKTQKTVQKNVKKVKKKI